MNNKSTDRQVYNESKQQSGNLLVYHSKATVVFYFFYFLYNRMKELQRARIKWKWLNVKSSRIIFQTTTPKNQ